MPLRPLNRRPVLNNNQINTSGNRNLSHVGFHDLRSYIAANDKVKPECLLMREYRLSDNLEHLCQLLRTQKCSSRRSFTTAATEGCTSRDAAEQCQFFKDFQEAEIASS